MKKLTKKEVKFIKETNFTPTVFQCDEYSRTPFKDFNEAVKVAKKEYRVDLYKLLKKVNSLEDADAISAEINAVYLLETFFTYNELTRMTTAVALEWLKNFKYFYGYRKWDENKANLAKQEALEDFMVTECLNESWDD